MAEYSKIKVTITNTDTGEVEQESVGRVVYCVVVDPTTDGDVVTIGVGASSASDTLRIGQAMVSLLDEFGRGDYTKSLLSHLVFLSAYKKVFAERYPVLDDTDNEPEGGFKS